MKDMLVPYEIVVSRWSRMEITIEMYLWQTNVSWIRTVVSSWIPAGLRREYCPIKVLHVDCSLFRGVNNGYDKANETEPCVSKQH